MFFLRCIELMLFVGLFITTLLTAYGNERVPLYSDETVLKLQICELVGIAKKEQNNRMALALTCINEASDLAQGYPDVATYTALLLMRSKLLKLNGAFYDALHAGHHALTLADSTENYFLLIRALKTIGSIYLYSQDYHRASTYFNQQLQLANRLGDEEGVLIAYRQLGHVYRLTGNYREALNYYERALCMACPIQAQPCWRWPSFYGDIGKTYDGLKQYRKALGFHLQRLHKLQAGRKANRYAFSDAYLNLGKTQLALHDPKAALDAGKRGVELAKELNNQEHLKDHLFIVYKAHESLGHYREALYYYSAYTVLKDSLNGAVVTARMNELETKYKTERQHQMINELLREREMRDLKTRQGAQFTLIVLGIGMLLVVILFLLFHLYRTLHKQQKAALLEQLFRAQINPHFIFNSLMSVQGIIYDGDVRKADIYLTKIARFIRGTLENSQDEYISLNKELRALSYYLELQAMRLGERFAYKIDVDAQIELTILQLPSLILQFYLEGLMERIIFKTSKEHLVNFRLSVHLINHVLHVDCSCFIQGSSVYKEVYQPLEPVIEKTKQRLDWLNKYRNRKKKMEIKLRKGTILQSVASYSVVFIVPLQKKDKYLSHCDVNSYEHDSIINY